MLFIESEEEKPLRRPLHLPMCIEDIEMKAGENLFIGLNDRFAVGSLMEKKADGIVLCLEIFGLGEQFF